MDDETTVATDYYRMLNAAFLICPISTFCLMPALATTHKSYMPSIGPWESDLTTIAEFTGITIVDGWIRRSPSHFNMDANQFLQYMLNN